MKKILTLAVALLALSTVFAQRDESRRVILGDDRTVYDSRNDRYPQQYPGSYPTTSREQRIYEINREYDARIYNVRYDRRLSRREREHIIRRLEWERHQRIAAINAYYSRSRRYDDDRCDDNRYDRKWEKRHRDHGNHYGWEHNDSGNDRD